MFSVKSVSCDFDDDFMCGYVSVQRGVSSWNNVDGATSVKIYRGPATDRDGSSTGMTRFSTLCTHSSAITKFA